jgi:diaminopimelate dehydrogenase
MQRRRLAIVGLGRLGQACAHAILESDDLALAGFVRRAETVLNPLPTQLAGIPAVSHPSELGAVDAVLICLPTELVCEVAAGLLRHHTPIIEAATLDGIARQEHWRAIDRMALRRGVPAAVGAGWNPGIRPLFEGLFVALCPKGGTRIPTTRPVSAFTTPLPRRQFRASVTHFARKCEESKVSFNAMSMWS